MQARKGLRATLGEIVAERRAQGDTDNECGLLDTLMQWRDGSGTALTADQIADNVIGVLFAAQDTTASALTWILKYLHDDPKLLEAVKVRSRTPKALERTYYKLF
jgi:(+)-abscisic acid 8'-hydroxylase